jgi:hypothetical protein
MLAFGDSAGTVEALLTKPGKATARMKDGGKARIQARRGDSEKGLGECCVSVVGAIDSMALSLVALVRIYEHPRKRAFFVSFPTYWHIGPAPIRCPLYRKMHWADAAAALVCSAYHE